MLKNEERIAEVKRRIGEKERTAETAAQTDCLRILHSGMPCSDRWGFPLSCQVLSDRLRPVLLLDLKRQQQF